MHTKVTSKDNKIYKQCSQLSQKKYRDKEGKYLIEGENLLAEALKNNVKPEMIVLREGRTCPMDVTGIDLYTMEEKLFARLAQTEKSQGILAVVEKPKDGIERIKNNNTPVSNLLVLDRLQDPGNIGTVIRTADAAGYLGIIALKGTGDVYSPKVIRAAAGSVFRIPIIYVENNRELKEFASSLNKRIVATTFDTNHFYYQENLAKGIALIIGNEGNGISEELLSLADVKVKIPMKGNIESLNASIAAGIIMYEAMREE